MVFLSTLRPAFRRSVMVVPRFTTNTTTATAMTTRSTAPRTATPMNIPKCYMSSGAFSPDQLASAMPQTEPTPPSSMNIDIARGIQACTAMYIEYGVGNQRLLEIQNQSNMELVWKWQKCMEAFLGTQVHVLAGLGYSPDEKGIAMFNQQLSFFVQEQSPEIQEELRISGRDIWRKVLATAFGIELKGIKELSIVDARNMMHQVSLKMQDTTILKDVAKQCASIVPNDNPQIETAQKHHIIQNTLVHKVYLGGEPSLVKMFGFGDGEEGYVKLQLAMTEHQTDPLVAQYVGTAMMKIFTAAGIDAQAMRREVQDIDNDNDTNKN